MRDISAKNTTLSLDASVVNAIVVAPPGRDAHDTDVPVSGVLTKRWLVDTCVAGKLSAVKLMKPGPDPECCGIDATPLAVTY